MMDIEAFSDDNFDAVNWINASFKDYDNKQPKEALVSSIVSKLQLYVQQLNSTLEDTSQQVLSGMPRIMKDAQNLQTEAQSLRIKMNEVQKDIADVQQETGACMEHLERLDCLKTKLQVAKQGLLESDGWGRLTSELEDLLEQSDLMNSREKLVALQKSLNAQTGLAGQSEREAQVEGFKNRMEALASPGVVDCFTSGDIDKSKLHVSTFATMGRLPQLYGYYRTVQRNILQQHWSEILDLNANSGSSSFLREYYEFLFTHWQRQLKWCSSVFGPTQANEPTQVIYELLGTLQPSRETAVTGCLKRTNDKLTVLQEFSSANLWFSQSFLNHFKDESLPEKLVGAIFDWFMVFVSQYASMEQSHLGTLLAELQLVHSTTGESVRSLGNANGKVFSWFEEALRRCDGITQNCGLPALVSVINGIFRTFLDKYKKAQQQLQASRTVEQNWSLLQSCISLLQHVGNFSEQLIQLDAKMVQLVLDKHEQLNDAKLAVPGYKIIGKREINEFQNLVELINNGNDSDGVGHVFKAPFDQVTSICEYIHDTTLASVFAPVEMHLKTIDELESLSSSSGAELPDYSFAPQEFITQVGQYLLTLPQHLEPLLLAPSAPLRSALRLCDERYANESTASADILLSLLADETCALFEEQIGKICELSAAGAKQLATDIEYLGSVLEELGLGLGVHLQQTAALLRSPPETYLTLSAGCDPKLVTAIRQMRNIVSME